MPCPYTDTSFIVVCLIGSVLKSLKEQKSQTADASTFKTSTIWLCFWLITFVKDLYCLGFSHLFFRLWPLFNVHIFPTAMLVNRVIRQPCCIKPRQTHGSLWVMCFNALALHFIFSLWAMHRVTADLLNTYVQLFQICLWNWASHADHSWNTEWAAVSGPVGFMTPQSPDFFLSWAQRMWIRQTE